MLKASKEQLLKRLELDNPWWKGGGIDADLENMPRRDYFKPLYERVHATDIRRAVIVYGPRRVGKTVLLHHVISKMLKEGFSGKQIFFISVDTPLYTHISLEALFDLAIEAAGSRREEQITIFFDEIQYQKDWHVQLKVLVDRQRTHRFVASGSAAAALARQSYESGAGRFSDFYVPPILFCEYTRFKNSETLCAQFSDPKSLAKLNELFVDYVNYGGFPEIIFSDNAKQNPEQFVRKDIIDKVLLRDLPSLYGIQNVQELNSLFTMLAFNSAQEISLEEVSKNSHVPKLTINRYIEYLEAAFLIKKSYKLGEDGKNFTRKHHFKIFLTNPSMRAALFTPLNADDPFIGHMIETAVAAQHQHFFEGLGYARWKNGEIDFVLRDQRERISGVLEVKWSDTPTIKNLIYFCKKNNLSTAHITTKTLHQTLKIDGIQIHFIPNAVFCNALGKLIINKKMELNLVLDQIEANEIK